MKKYILVPDSFKGTMSSSQVSEIMKEVIVKYAPDSDVMAIPVADGGEGTVDCFLQALNGEKVFIKTKGPIGEDADSFYGICEDVAIIEMAASAGLPLALHRLDPLKATTYGVGELVKDAISRGCKKVIIGLGGSCTNDAGSGMAAALGTKFYDKQGNSLVPTGGTLSEVVQIDLSETKKLLKDVEIIAMCDIDNPMYGKSGAAYIFGPQKGADMVTIKILDEQLEKFSQTIKKCLGIDVSQMKGAGAAGAMGAGVYAFLNGSLKQGIDTVLDLVDFEELLEGCDCVFTGEGRLDDQSLSGKVVVGVGLRAKKKNVPVIAVVGAMEANPDKIYSNGITKVYQTNGKRNSFNEIKEHCQDDLRDVMERVIHDLVIS